MLDFKQAPRKLASDLVRGTVVSGLEPEAAMRSKADCQEKQFLAIDLGARIGPGRLGIKAIVERILAGLSEVLETASDDTGRPSVPAEQLLKVLLLTAHDAVRSERRLAEQIDTGLLCRRFLDGNPPADVRRDHTGNRFNGSCSSTPAP